MSDPHPPASGHDHGHGHGHDHTHDHHHEPALGLAGRLRHLLRPHSHEAADQIDAVMEASKEGMRTLWISLGVLGVTALVRKHIREIIALDNRFGAADLLRLSMRFYPA